MLYFDYFEVKYPSVNVCSVTHWVRWYPWPLTIMVAFKLLRIVETPHVIITIVWNGLFAACYEVHAQSYYAMNGNHIEEIEFEARRNVHINHDYLCLREYG